MAVDNVRHICRFKKLVEFFIFRSLFKSGGIKYQMGATRSIVDHGWRDRNSFHIGCHPERSEGSRGPHFRYTILRCAQKDGSPGTIGKNRQVH
jgi:hypothetical protein